MKDVEQILEDSNLPLNAITNHSNHTVAHADANVLIRRIVREPSEFFVDESIGRE